MAETKSIATPNIATPTVTTLTASTQTTSATAVTATTATPPNSAPASPKTPTANTPTTTTPATNNTSPRSSNEISPSPTPPLPDLTDDQQDTAAKLRTALRNRNQDTAKRLLTAENCHLAIDHEQNTALHWAAATNQISVLKKLLRLNANINAINATGNTPLHLAITKNNTFAVNLLLKANASTDLVNDHKQTPVTIAQIKASTKYSRDVTDLETEYTQKMCLDIIRQKKVKRNNVAVMPESMNKETTHYRDLQPLIHSDASIIYLYSDEQSTSLYPEKTLENEVLWSFQLCLARAKTLAKELTIVFVAFSEDHAATYACNTQGEILIANPSNAYKVRDNKILKSIKTALDQYNYPTDDDKTWITSKTESTRQTNPLNARVFSTVIATELDPNKSLVRQGTKINAILTEATKKEIQRGFRKIHNDVLRAYDGLDLEIAKSLDLVNQEPLSRALKTSALPNTPAQRTPKSILKRTLFNKINDKTPKRSSPPKGVFFSPDPPKVNRYTKEMEYSESEDASLSASFDDDDANSNAVSTPNDGSTASKKASTANTVHTPIVDATILTTTPSQTLAKSITRKYAANKKLTGTDVESSMLSVNNPYICLDAIRIAKNAIETSHKTKSGCCRFSLPRFFYNKAAAQRLNKAEKHALGVLKRAYLKQIQKLGADQVDKQIAKDYLFIDLHRRDLRFFGWGKTSLRKNIIKYLKTAPESSSPTKTAPHTKP